MFAERPLRADELLQFSSSSSAEYPDDQPDRVYVRYDALPDQAVQRVVLSRRGMLQMMFKLGICAEERWRKLLGFEQLAKIITGVKFKDGEEVTALNQDPA